MTFLRKWELLLNSYLNIFGENIYLNIACVLSKFLTANLQISFLIMNGYSYNMQFKSSCVES